MNNYSKVCKTCSTITDKNLLTFTLNSTIGYLTSITKTLFLCCPELDYQDVENTELCKTCLENANVLYLYWKLCCENEEEINKFVENVTPCIKYGKREVENISLNNSHNYFITNKADIFKNNSDICRTCLKFVNDKSEIFCMDYFDSKDHISIRTKLYLCCPQLDLRINPKAVVCKSCYDIICISYKFKSTFLKALGTNNRHLISSAIQPAFLNNEANIKQEVKVEAIDFSYKEGSLKGNSNILNLSNNKLRHKIILKKDIVLKDEKCYECHHCNFITKSKCSLKQHMVIHTSYKIFKCSQCDYCSKRKRNFVNHLLVHCNDKPLKCSQCNFNARHKLILKRHLLCHCLEKPFKCLHCSYRTVREYELKRHIMIHTQEKPFVCLYCTFKTCRKYNLKQHILTHTHEKMLKCFHCNYKTSRKNDLGRHVLTHTQQKPFKCLICDYTASRKDALVLHMLTHTGEKPFKCSYCDYSGTTKTYLRQHMHTHTGEKPFKCDTCQYSARSNAALKKHMCIHTGEMPFKCSYCSYSSRYYKSLKEHILIHNEETVFKCEECNFITRKKNRLNIHTHNHKKYLSYVFNSENVVLNSID